MTSRTHLGGVELPNVEDRDVVSPPRSPLLCSAEKVNEFLLVGAGYVAFAGTIEFAVTKRNDGVFVGWQITKDFVGKTVEGFLLVDVDLPTKLFAFPAQAESKNMPGDQKTGSGCSPTYRGVGRNATKAAVATTCRRGVCASRVSSVAGGICICSRGSSDRKKGR